LASLVLSPREDGVATPQAPLLSLVMAVSVAETLAKWAVQSQVQLKWPNDVLLEGRKVCGLLAESLGQGDELTHLILGIGVNLNNPISHAPAPLRETAIALCDVLQRPVSVAQFTLDLMRLFEAHYAQFRNQGFAPFRALWNQRDALADCIVTVKHAAQETTGRALGLGEDGSLRLATEQGEVSIASGVVQQVRPVHP